jgi:hypothetical protein
VGRLATGLVVCVVAVVVAVAVVDSFRGGSDETEPPPPTGPTDDAVTAGVESRIAIANRLRHERIRGRLLYTDERCALRAISLPDLESAATPGFRGLGCGFSASPDGERVATPGAAWSPDSRRVAVCRGPRVVVSVASERAPEVERIDGCLPAWRPDGVLTLVRNGEVVEAAGRTLVPVRAIRAAARAHVVAPDPPELEIAYTVVDLAWLTPRRVALLLSIFFSSAGHELEPQTQVALFDDGRVVATEDALGPAWTRLEARRGLVAVRPGFLLDSLARRLYPQVGVGTGGAGAVGVSPDGLWVAVALRGRVTLLSVRALRAGRFRSVSLPFAARDLAWR